MSLLIDIGNTRTKWFLTDGDGVLKDMGAWDNTTIEEADITQFSAQAKRALIAAVGATSVVDYLVSKLEQCGLLAIFVQSQQQCCGVINTYKEPTTLGVDRWLSLIAANQSDYGTSLIVTAGTAVTMDALRVEGESATFIGGTIMPGLQLMQSALHKKTENLPMAQGQHQAFPLNTDDAIYTGALNALFNAIQYQWKSLYDVVKIPPKLVLSGGDAKLIAQKLPSDLANHMIIVDNLVLRGLMHLEKENAV